MIEALRQPQGTFVTDENLLIEHARFKEHEDASIIVRFPPDFFQKIMKHTREYPDEEVTMHFTDSRLILRRMKKPINLVRPVDRINGQIVSWCFLKAE